MTRRNRQCFWLASFMVAGLAAPARAQSEPRIEISFDAGAIRGSASTEADSFPSNGGETATVTVTREAETAPMFAAGGAVRLVSRLWVGAEFSMARMKESAEVSAVIPHPILFDAPRTVEGTAEDLEHSEQSVHVDVMYAVPLGAFEVRLLAGRTFTTLKQDFVSAVTVNETYPFDTATFGSATTTRLSDSAVGFNAGADVSYAVTERLAIGGLVRYSRADVKFSDDAIGSRTVKAGGVEAAGGVRIRF